MGGLLAFLLAANILIIPALIVFQVQGGCTLVEPYLIKSFPKFCTYINNVWFNILYANAGLIVIALTTASSRSGVGGKSAPRASSPKPSGGSSKGGGGHH